MGILKECGSVKIGINENIEDFDEGECVFDYRRTQIIQGKIKKMPLTECDDMKGVLFFKRWKNRRFVERPGGDFIYYFIDKIGKKQYFTEWEYGMRIKTIEADNTLAEIAISQDWITSPSRFENLFKWIHVIKARENFYLVFEDKIGSTITILINSYTAKTGTACEFGRCLAQRIFYQEYEELYDRVFAEEEDE